LNILEDWGWEDYLSRENFCNRYDGIGKWVTCPPQDFTGSGLIPGILKNHQLPVCSGIFKKTYNKEL
jgi:hypothetical protein